MVGAFESGFILGCVTSICICGMIAMAIKWWRETK